MDVLVFGDDTNFNYFCGAAKIEHNNNKKTFCQCHLLVILEYFDLSHSLGKGVTLQKVKNHLSIKTWIAHVKIIHLICHEKAWVKVFTRYKKKKKNEQLHVRDNNRIPNWLQ